MEIQRSSETDLEVVEAMPNDGWAAQTTAPSGPRVKVRFTDEANPDSITRFAASMDDAGREMHIRVTSCG